MNGQWVLCAFIAAGLMTPEEADAVWNVIALYVLPPTPSAAYREVMDVLEDLREHPFDGEIKWQTPSLKI